LNSNHLPEGPIRKKLAMFRGAMGNAAWLGSEGAGPCVPRSSRFLASFLGLQAQPSKMAWDKLPRWVGQRGRSEVGHHWWTGQGPSTSFVAAVRRADNRVHPYQRSVASEDRSNRKKRDGTGRGWWPWRQIGAGGAVVRCAVETVPWLDNRKAPERLAGAFPESGL